MKKYSTSVSLLVTREQLSNTLNLENMSQEKINSTKKRLLRNFGFDIDTIDIDNSEITLKVSTSENFVKMNPSITRSYYDEEDILTQKVKKGKNNDDLVNFEGEIYEKLTFDSDEEANTFAKEHGYSMPLYKDTTALIHFKGLEWNNRKIAEVNDIKNKTEEVNLVLTPKSEAIIRSELSKALEEKELYIVKTQNMYTVYYGEPLHYVNKSKEPGFNKEEIDIIIPVIEHFDHSYFVLYVRDALSALDINKANRGYNPNKDFISKRSMETYVECITDSNANPKDLVYIKIKVISDTPVFVDENITQKFDYHNEIDKKFKNLRP